VSSDLRPHQHSIGYTGDGFYRSKDPTNSIKVRLNRHPATSLSHPCSNIVGILECGLVHRKLE